MVIDAMVSMLRSSHLASSNWAWQADVWWVPMWWVPEVRVMVAEVLGDLYEAQSMMRAETWGTGVENCSVSVPGARAVPIFMPYPDLPE